MSWKRTIYLICVVESFRSLLFVCCCCFFLFVWSFWSRSRIFHSYGDVTFTSEGLHILTYARHSWPLSNESSLACHTYCNTGYPFLMVISENPWHSYLLLSVLQWSCHYLFLRLRSIAAGIRTPNLPHARRMLRLTVPPPRFPIISYIIISYLEWLLYPRLRLQNYDTVEFLLLSFISWR